MNYPIQPQNVPAPSPFQPAQQQLQPAQQQYTQPVQPPAPTQQQSQGVEFYGAVISQQDMNLIGQLYNTANTSLGIQLSDASTVFKSLYFGSRDLFKTLYVNQISSERGSKPTTPDYEKAQSVFESTFGTIAEPKINEMQICLAMKAFAGNMLPDLMPNNSRPHVKILDHIVMLNWHSQNARTNSNINRNNGNGNGNGNVTSNNPFTPNPNNSGGAQSKASQVAGFPPTNTQAYAPTQPMQQPPTAPGQPTGFVPQQQLNYTPQSAAQNVMQTMPTYAG